MSRRSSTVLFVIYIIIGVVVAAGRDYFENLDALKPIASAVLAVLLWPLVLLGISLYLKQGRHRPLDSDKCTVQPTEGRKRQWTTRFFGWLSAWWWFFSSCFCFGAPAADEACAVVEGFAGGGPSAASATRRSSLHLGATCPIRVSGWRDVGVDQMPREASEMS
jgi:hypothetical protein